MKFHHVGIATESIDDALEYIKKHFNVTHISETIFDPNQKADLCMITLDDNFQLELIAGEVVKSILKKRQNLYHICYSVNNIDTAIENLSHDSIVLGKPQPAVLFNGKRVVFLLSKIGMMELLED